MNRLNVSPNYIGYVLYDRDGIRKPAIGIVSNNFRRQAIGSNIPSFIKNSIVHIEDQRFYNHCGIDFKAILRAALENFKAFKIVQGGSTITQQLARNLLANNDKTIARKVLEVLKAVELERKHTKAEILESYLNNVYFGNNLYGIRSASLYYFGREPKYLIKSEQLLLLTLLRGPNYYLKNLNKTQQRLKRLNDLLLVRKQIPLRKHKQIDKHKINLGQNKLSVFSDRSLNFLTQSSDEKSKTIITTLDSRLQNALECWISEEKYPLSIICIEKGKVKAVASSYGNDYPFYARANVGSTLKPFIFTYLRDYYYNKTDLINTINTNKIGWKVREVSKVKPQITLSEALLKSNNNAFINASFGIGIQNVYTYLSLLLQKPITEFSPSSLLGATKSGISLFELAECYNNFFCRRNKTPTVVECLNVLQAIAKEKIGHDIENIFLKTGTTNSNKERYAIIGDENKVFAFLRGDNETDDYSKEGNFIGSIKRFASRFMTTKKSYKWIS